jgi:hypothetical protein
MIRGKYSQSGEEFSIVHILSKITNGENFLVDLGAGDGYSLSNSRFLLENGYSGILIDGNNRSNHEVHQCWITSSNICSLLSKYGCPIDFDLLSIDLDGNDLYILEAIVKQYHPRLIVAEFNAEIDGSFVIEYNDQHVWAQDDYFGFTFKAAEKWAERHEYFIAHQIDNVNLFMIRSDLKEAYFKISYGQTHRFKPSGKKLKHY